MKILLVALMTFGLVAASANTTLGAKKKATISKSAAEKIALERTPGKVREAELETENKILVWSFDIDTASGIQEVQVDAHTGAIVSVEAESAEHEAQEKAAEKKPRQ